MVFDPPRNFIEYRNGSYWVIATKISVQRYLNQMNDQEIQEEVKQKQDLIEKMGIKDALPSKSEPNIFLIENSIGRNNSPGTRK